MAKLQIFQDISPKLCQIPLNHERQNKCTKMGERECLNILMILMEHCWICSWKSYLTYSNKATIWLWSCASITSKGCSKKNQVIRMATTKEVRHVVRQTYYKYRRDATKITTISFSISTSSWRGIDSCNLLEFTTLKQNQGQSGYLTNNTVQILLFKKLVVHVYLKKHKPAPEMHAKVHLKSVEKIWAQLQDILYKI